MLFIDAHRTVVLADHVLDRLFRVLERYAARYGRTGVGIRYFERDLVLADRIEIELVQADQIRLGYRQKSDTVDRDSKVASKRVFRFVRALGHDNRRAALVRNHHARLDGNVGFVLFAVKGERDYADLFRLAVLDIVIDLARYHVRSYGHGLAVLFNLEQRS